MTLTAFSLDRHGPGPDSRPDSRAKTLSRGGGLKPTVRLLQCGEQRIVLKDYSASPWYLRPLAAYLVRREIKILRALESQSFAPNYIESLDAYRFAMEYVDGIHPSVKSRSAGGEIYRKAQQALAALHRLGYAHNDLHSRNILVHPQRGVVFIDFVAALRFASPPASERFHPLAWLRQRLQHADRYNLVKRKRHLSAQPLDKAEQALLGGGRAFGELTRWWKRLIHVRRQRRFRLHPNHCGCSANRLARDFHRG